MLFLPTPSLLAVPELGFLRSLSPAGAVAGASVWPIPRGIPLGGPGDSPARLNPLESEPPHPGTDLSTTTMGLSLPVTTMSPFQIMRAEDTIMPKFNTW